MSVNKILIKKGGEEYCTLSKEEYQGLKECLNRYMSRKFLSQDTIDKSNINEVYDDLIMRDYIYDESYMNLTNSILTARKINADLVKDFIFENAKGFEKNLTIIEEETYTGYCELKSDEFKDLDLTDSIAVEKFCSDKYKNDRDLYYEGDGSKDYGGYYLKVQLDFDFNLFTKPIKEFNYKEEDTKVST